MYSEPRPLPAQHGSLYEVVSSQPWSSYSLYNQNIPVSSGYDLIRFYQEKNFLSMQLADCVTYLKALREKQNRNNCQLNTDSALPQKKRKRLQQNKRHLYSEIRNREMEEKACLNNLQACETNIIFANMQALHLANALPESTLTPILDTPTLCSYSGSEATDLTWEGWTDETVVSPFQKRASNPFFVDDPAPDVCTDGFRRDSVISKDLKRPPPLAQDAVELSNSIPAPPNTAQSQFRRSSILNPEAVAFQPVKLSSVRETDRATTQFKRLSMSSATATKAKELLQQRRFSAAEIDPILQRFSIDRGTSAESDAVQTDPATGCERCSSAAPQLDRERMSSL